MDVAICFLAGHLAQIAVAVAVAVAQIAVAVAVAPASAVCHFPIFPKVV